MNQQSKEERDAQSILRKIDSLTPKENAKDIRCFYNQMVARGLAAGTPYNYLKILYKLTATVRKPFRRMTKQDIVGFFGSLRRADGKPYSDTTEWQYKSGVKTFWKQLYSGEYYPEQVKWIKKEKRHNKLRVIKILDEEQVQRIIRVAKKPKTAALVAIYYETGARLSEITNMRLKDIQRNGTTLFAYINGKTGQRKAYFIESRPLLEKWLAENPYKELSCFVFASSNSGGKKPLSREAVRLTIRRLAKKAGITERVYPHLLRHSAATRRVRQGFSTPELVKLFGWQEFSQMPATYTHLVDGDIESKLKRTAGIEEKTKPANQFTPWKCCVCGEDNASTEEFCGRCRSPQNSKSAFRLDELLEQNKTQQDTIMTLRNLTASMDGRLKQLESMQVQTVRNGRR